MSTIKANTLLHSNGSTTTPPAIPALDKRMAKAWINFRMDTQAIRTSYNISSITDAGVGKTTISMTNPVTLDRVVTGISAASGFVSLYAQPTSTTDMGTYRCFHNNGTSTDFTYVALAVFSN